MDNTASPPLVSIIVRTRNRPQLLPAALDSIAAQTYPRLQVIVVNDGGVDIEYIVHDFRDRIQLLDSIVHTSGLGRTAALNSGLERADGEWIGFLDDDDVFVADHIETLVAAARESLCGLVYGQTRVTTLSTDTIELEDFYFAENFSYPHLLIENYISLISILVHQQVIGVAGIFDDRLEMFEDWDFLIRAGQYTRFLSVEQVTAVYQRHPGSITIANQLDSALYEEQRALVWEKNFDLIHQYWPGIVQWTFEQRNQAIRLRSENENLKNLLTGQEGVFRKIRRLFRNLFCAA